MNQARVVDLQKRLGNGRGQLTQSVNVQRPVLDRTGLSGNFDFELQWAPGLQADSASADSSPSIFAAVQEQLGLKLESTKGPVDMVIVDHIERPTED